MSRIVFLLILLFVLCLGGCGNVEWFPDSQQQSTPTTNTNQSLGKYVATNQETATDTSFVYHFPTHGMNIIIVDHRIWFQTAAAAIATGRRPCLICNPPTVD